MANNTAKGVKKSSFSSNTLVPNGSYFDFVYNGQNIRIKDSDFYAALGVTGSIEQDGDPSGTPILDIQGSVNAIRNITGGFGISATVNAQNGVTLDTDFSFNQTGADLVDDVTASSPVFRSLVGGTGVTTTGSTGIITIDANTADLIVIVSSGADLTGVLDSTKVYAIDGTIDMTGLGAITIPSGGLTITGYGTNVSVITSSTASHIMFDGDGSLFAKGVTFTVTGTSAKVFDLTANTGSEAAEFETVNFTNCTSLGEISGYRQYLELNTARIGGGASLTFSGTMSGGISVTTSVAVAMSDTSTAPLFKRGTALSIGTRFKTNINCDLGTLMPFCDFTNSDFVNPSSYIISGARFSRDGVVDATDSNINTGITKSELAAQWDDNVGIPNTFEGGRLSISGTSATALSGQPIGTYLDLAGTYTADNLEHFDSPASGQIRHIGDTPRQYKFYLNIDVAGTAADVITVKVVKYDSSATSFSDIASQTREINNFTGSSDKAFFAFQDFPTLDENDYLKIQVKNDTAARDVTAQVGSYLIVEAR